MHCPHRMLVSIAWACSFFVGFEFLTPEISFAQNFSCRDLEVLAAAERARIRSATYWTGRPFPSHWSSPCPIVVTSWFDPPAGTTRFQFADGEVFGWRMEIRGSKARLLNDVIPHEVDHMVRASLVRRPIPRWLDEGCAALLESAATQQALRESAAGIASDFITADWLDALAYPGQGVEQHQLYAAGLVLVEILLAQGGPEKLLQLQQGSPPASKRLVELYQLSPEALQTVWNGHVRRLQTPADSAADSPGTRLTVWTSRWCAPCRRFWEDWNRDSAFRNRLQSQFQVRMIDIDLNPQAATAHHIVSVPCFEFSDQIVKGYEGTKWLEERLGIPAMPSDQTLTVPWPDHDLVSPQTGSQPPENVPPPGEPPTLTPSPPPVVPPSNPDRGPTSSAIWPQTAPPEPRFWKTLLGVAVSIGSQWLPLTGLVGGTLATGGVGGIALTLASFWIKRRWQRRLRGSESRVEVGSAAPFPRQLDEARELLGLRQSEGRVAALDALRGMFLDDELDKLSETRDSATLGIVNQLRSSINRRVDEVAPLATSSTAT